VGNESVGFFDGRYDAFPVPVLQIWKEDQGEESVCDGVNLQHGFASCVLFQIPFCYWIEKEGGIFLACIARI
jgi:hypothetical protein